MRYGFTTESLRLGSKTGLTMFMAMSYGGEGSGLARCGEIGFGEERVGEESVCGQAALGGKFAACRLYHHRRAAGVHLRSGEVRMVGHHRAVDEAGAAVPAIRLGRLGQHRHEPECR